MALNDPTLEQLRALVNYDPNTGVFTWLARDVEKAISRRAASSFNAKFAGKPAGHLNRSLGYVLLLECYAHRLAWLYVTGSMPMGEIDHLNGNRADNRFSNLRDVCSHTNKQNRRIPRAGKAHGLPIGVRFREDLKSKPFFAQITHRRKCMHLGYYATAEEAHSAYVERKRELHAGNTL